MARLNLMRDEQLPATTQPGAHEPRQSGWLLAQLAELVVGSLDGLAVAHIGQQG